jgi:hypothetical protein
VKYLDLNGTLWYAKDYGLILVMRDKDNKKQLYWTRLYFHDCSQLHSGPSTDTGWYEDVKNFGYQYVGTLFDLDLESFVNEIKI